MVENVQLMTPCAALGRGLRRTVVEGGRILFTDSEEVALRRAFFMGGSGFVIDGICQMEVIDSPTVFPLPNTPRTCRGLINLRGDLVPVFDVRRLTGGEGGAYKWVLVLGRAEVAAGLVIDQLPVQIKLSESSQLESLPELSEPARGAVSEAYRVEGQVYFVIDYQKLLERLVDSAQEQEVPAAVDSQSS